MDYQQKKTNAYISNIRLSSLIKKVEDVDNNKKKKSIQSVY